MVGIILTSIAGSTLTFYFAEKLQWGAVKSSALLSLFFGCLSLVINQFYLFDHELYSLYFFGASFVGMSSKKHFSYFEIILAACLYGFLLSIFKEHFKGIGGGLGTTASITVIIVYLLKRLQKQLTRVNKDSSGL